MNKTISTRTGILTAIFIILYIVLLQRIHISQTSGWAFLPFLFIFLGIIISNLFLYKYYAGIAFIDVLTHSVRTLSTILFLLIVGHSILYFLFTKNNSMQEWTWMLMKTIFAYGLSGMLSAFFCSFIFYTFTKNKK
ncbi:MAG: hypothetical protein R2831_00320 [Chitinophagaceae bacterium]